MPRNRKPPSQTWRAFLKNHAKQLVSVDFFVVPTLSFRLLFVFVVLEHHHRRVVHFNVTAHPTTEWTAQQMREAFSWDSSPRFLIRDRDGCYGDVFRLAVRGMNIQEVLTAPHSPWQNGYVERLIGSIRRECLDHENPALVLPLLRANPNPSGARERPSRITRGPASRTRCCGETARSWRASPSLRTPCRLSFLGLSWVHSSGNDPQGNRRMPVWFSATANTKPKLTGFPDQNLNRKSFLLVDFGL